MAVKTTRGDGLSAAAADDQRQRQAAAGNLRPAFVTGLSVAALFASCCSLGAAAPALAAEQPAGPAQPLQIAQQGGARQFSIPAQALPSALARFSEQAGISFAYRTDDLSGLASPGASGTLTPTEALARLLAGTNVTYRFTDPATVTLMRGPAAGSGAVVLDPIRVVGTEPASTTAQIGNLPPAYAGGHVASGSSVGMLGNRDVMDTPFNTSSYTARMVEDRQAATVADVLENDPSVRSSASKAGILDAFFIRGFPIGEGNLGEIAFNGVYGVAPNYRVFADYVERIEVVKGPTALLYGMAPNSSVGGTINIVPKRAPEEDLTRVTADYASDTQFGGQFDLGRRFGDDRAFGLRVNGSYHDGDTALDNQSREAFVGAVALDYQGERLRGSLDLINQVEDFDAPVRPILVAPGVDVPSAPDGRRNVTQPWAWSETVDRSVQMQGEFDATDNVTFFANVGGGRTTVDRLSDQVQTILNAAGDTSTTPMYFKFEVDRITYGGGVRASLDTGRINHAVTLQASRYEDELSRGSTAGTAPILSNIYDPVASAPVALAEPDSVPRVSDSELVGFAAADTLSILDERVQLTLGGRYQTIEARNFNPANGAVTSSYDDNALTPMAGIVVKPWEHVSLYANYIEGLSRGDIAPSTATNAGEALEPYVAEQQEIGVKIDFGDVIGTVSAFQIEKPFGELDGTVFGPGGEQRNRGLEFSLFGEAVEDVRFLAGLTLLDAELTRTSNPANRGNRPIGVPEIQANISAEWDTPFLPGLTLGGSVIYTGSAYVDAANTQDIPSWTRLDLGARYLATIADLPVTFRATIENVLDNDYWSGVAGSYGGLGRGAPRTVLLSVATDF